MEYYFLAALIAVNIWQFILMTPKLNVRLVFFCVQSAILAAAMIILAVFFFTVCGVITAVICAAYTLGSAIHLGKGKRTVKDVFRVRE